MTLRGALARQSDVQLRRRDQKVSAALFHVTLPYQDPSRCHVQNIEVTWPPVRAELAINLSRCPRSPGACGYLVVACGSLFGTRLIFSRCKALLVLMGLGRLSFEGRFSRAGREVVLPCGFESPRLPTRKTSRSAMRSRGLFLWLGRRDSNPQQPAPKTGVLPLNYVPMCGVAQKQPV